MLLKCAHCGTDIFAFHKGGLTPITCKQCKAELLVHPGGQVELTGAPAPLADTDPAIPNPIKPSTPASPPVPTGEEPTAPAAPPPVVATPPPPQQPPPETAPEVATGTPPPAASQQEITQGMPPPAPVLATSSPIDAAPPPTEAPPPQAVEPLQPQPAHFADAPTQPSSPPPAPPEEPARIEITEVVEADMELEELEPQGASEVVETVAPPQPVAHAHPAEPVQTPPGTTAMEAELVAAPQPRPPHPAEPVDSSQTIEEQEAGTKPRGPITAVTRLADLTRPSLPEEAPNPWDEDSAPIEIPWADDQGQGAHAHAPAPAPTHAPPPTLQTDADRDLSLDETIPDAKFPTLLEPELAPPLDDQPTDPHIAIPARADSQRPDLAQTLPSEPLPGEYRAGTSAGTPTLRSQSTQPPTGKKARRGTLEWRALSRRSRTGWTLLFVFTVLSGAVWATGIVRIPGVAAPLAKHPWVVLAKKTIGLPAVEKSAQETQVAVATPTPTSATAVPPEQVVEQPAAADDAKEDVPEKELAAGEDILADDLAELSAPPTAPLPPKTRQTRKGRKAAGKAKKPAKTTAPTKADAAKLYATAVTYLKQKKVTLAIAELKKAIRADPKHADSHRALGLAYNALKQERSAVRAFEAFIKLAPRHRDAAKLKSFIAAYYEKNPK